LTTGLLKLAEEDPTFRVRTDEESVVKRSSLEWANCTWKFIVDRLRREFKVEVSQGAPQVAYREAITKKVDHREVYKKQTGGRGKFADVYIEFGPAEKPESHLEWVDDIKGGVIPKEFIAPIEKGILSGNERRRTRRVPCKRCALHACTSVASTTLTPMRLSFELAGRMAFKAACRQAGPILLEPIMAVEVVTPEEYMGSVVGDLNKRRGQMEGMDYRGKDRVVKAKVPLSEMFGYVTQLRTISFRTCSLLHAILALCASTTWHPR
jgi:elongation factor G